MKTYLSNSSQITKCHLNRTENNDLTCEVNPMRTSYNYKLVVNMLNALGSGYQEFICNVATSGE